VKDEKGNVVAGGGSPPEPVSVHPPEVQYFLLYWPSDDISTLCEYTLNKLKKFVEVLRTKNV
jgi:hypothetical protein